MVKSRCYLWAVDAALTRQGCIAVFNHCLETWPPSFTPLVSTVPFGHFESVQSTFMLETAAASFCLLGGTGARQSDKVTVR